MTLSYTLLTGATGLLGRYLLRDLLLAGFPVAVLVRGRRGQPAADRVETILAHWERESGRALPRPMVLKAALEKQDLGLDEADREWLRHHCGRVIHSAASLKFATDKKDNEPWRTNVEGTKHVLELCQELGIGEFHHISTAYVAGLRTGVAREDELETGQRWANPYEESKVVAERAVRASSFLNDLTVYRPSIIVGDSVTGYSSSFHGFYTPLRVSHALAPKLPDADATALDFLSIFDLVGPEGKNLVPVNWVSAAILRIFSKRELHGRTYHLTSPVPVTARDMQQTFLETVKPRIGINPVAATAENLLELAAAMAEQLKVYQSYWRNDPSFDGANTTAALPDLPCPVLDRARLRLLSRYAVENNFGLPAEPLTRATYPFSERFAHAGGEGHHVKTPKDARLRVGLEVTGHGGGGWQFEFAEGRIAGSAPGLPAEAALTFHLSSGTLHQLAEGRLSPTQALENGRTLVLGCVPFDTPYLAQLLGALVPTPATVPGHKAARLQPALSRSGH